MKIKIKNYFGIVPKKAHLNDGAFDLYAPQDIELVHGRQVIDLGFAIELPHGYAATIQPRSGFSCKGMEVKFYRTQDLFSGQDIRIDADVIRGLVDENYRGHVGVIVKVNSKIYEGSRLVIAKGTRIAQMQIVEVPEAEFEEVDELSDSDRAEGGFGSTGK